MKRNTISLRRRHLVIAGLAGVAAPATLFAGQCSAPRNAPAVAELFASGNEGKDRLVVSGRIVGAPDGKPLAGATVEVWHADESGDYSADHGKIARGTPDSPGSPPCASVTTDADGRFVFTTIAPAEYSGRPRHIRYRVSHQGHAMPVTQLYFAPARGVSDDRVAQLQRDDNFAVAQLQRDNAGTWRATFGLTLA